MKCVVCMVKLDEDDDLCEACKSVMDMIYSDDPDGKDKALELFRKSMECVENEMV